MAAGSAAVLWAADPFDAVCSCTTIGSFWRCLAAVVPNTAPLATVSAATGASVAASPSAQQRQLHQQEVQVGQPARLHGIMSYPALNGQLGILYAIPDTEQRWKVQMADGSGLLLKPVNTQGPVLFTNVELLRQFVLPRQSVTEARVLSWGC